jgi:hypothetical protein
MRKFNREMATLIIIVSILAIPTLLVYWMRYAPPTKVSLMELQIHPSKFLGERITVSGRIRWAKWGGHEGKIYLPLSQYLPESIRGNDYRGIGYGGGPEFVCRVFHPSIPMPDPKIRYSSLPQNIYETGIRARQIENSKVDYTLQEPQEDSITELTGRWVKRERGTYYLEIEHFKLISTVPPTYFTSSQK